MNLYTRDFFQLGRERLRPGGVMCLWVPPDTKSEIKMILRTYLDVFPHVLCWQGLPDLGFCLLGSERPIRDVEEKFVVVSATPPSSRDLVEWSDDFETPEKVLKLFIGDERRLAPVLADERVITDDRPYTEFPLGRSLFDARGYREPMDALTLRKEFDALGPAPKLEASGTRTDGVGSGPSP